MIGLFQFREWRDGNHLLVGEDRHPVADGVERIEIVGDHEDGQPERVAEAPDERVELFGGHRIEARGRLVEEQDVGVERDRARDPRALAHAAGELGWPLCAGIVGQAGELDLERGQIADEGGRQVGMLDERRLDIFLQAQRREQGAPLKHDPDPPLDLRPRLWIVDVAAEDLDVAALGPLQPEDGVQQHRFARPRSADQPQYLVALDLEIEPVVNDRLAEGGAKALDADRRRLLRIAAPIPAHCPTFR